MKSETNHLRECPKCGVASGQYHEHFCSFQECPYCGGRFTQCFHSVDTIPLDDIIPWSGESYGAAECREFGWFIKLGPGGWETCGKDEPGAIPDVIRLHRTARWDRENKRFVQYAGEDTVFDDAQFLLTDAMAVQMQVSSRDGEFVQTKVGDAYWSLEELCAGIDDALGELQTDGWFISFGERLDLTDRFVGFLLTLEDFTANVYGAMEVDDE